MEMAVKGPKGTKGAKVRTEEMRVGREKVILTVNGGSSSVKFAVFSWEEKGGRLFKGEVERVGDYRRAAGQVIASVRRELGAASIAGIGHRIVHGGAKLLKHQRITKKVVAELRRVQPLDLAHLPGEIALIEAFEKSFPAVPQVACFDTVFGRDLPLLSQMLSIPRRYYKQGVRRFGFHGLSYTYLMRQLSAAAGAKAASGKIILAHLGNGASMAAVGGGKPIDMSMGFTPLAGLMMGTRPGDLDPGAILYLMREENISPDKMDEFLSHQCGLLGVSATSSDMRDLLARRSHDPRAAQAVGLFCYQARKCIGAYYAALGGLNTLVFSGGIGEHAPQVRAEICRGLEGLGIQIDSAANNSGNPIISARNSAAAVRVIATDEEWVIAQNVRLLAAE